MTVKICIVVDCGPIQGKGAAGYCGKHYQRVRKWGDPQYVEANYGGQSGEIDADTGLLERVVRQVTRTDSCWLWEGSVNGDGYGSLRHLGVWWSVHRYVYTTLVGAIPEGLELDHTCNVRRCCNPTHLEPVTQAENKRRAGARRTHCAKGLHERTEKNQRRDGTSTRCRLCQNATVSRYRERKRLETR